MIRLLLVVPFESREVWDRVGRFKRQYPMYTYELWTPKGLRSSVVPTARWGSEREPAAPLPDGSASLSVP
ncbi:hypothetical protein ACFSC4_07600 [Deinococcus malanensis]|uniref:hypothetical protein n=1 Tax=Deinococcus malanensis TaxID=1706855 RepID=UPI0036459799